MILERVSQMQVPKVGPKIRFFFFVISCLVLNPAYSASSVQLCSGLKVVGGIEPPLSEVEVGMICGNANQPGWSHVPWSQVQFSLKHFLQERGYHSPKFTLLQADSGEVAVGERTRITSISILNDMGLVTMARKRDVIGSWMTPSVLDGLEKWVSQQLEVQGYGCVQVRSQAHAETGAVVLNVVLGNVVPFGSVSQESVQGIEEGVLRRYDAFSADQPFDSFLLTLTSNRINSQRVVESSHFLAKCEDGRVQLVQEIVPGLPRLVVVGLGANTEGLILGKFSWQNTRLGRMGSQANLVLEASARIQELQTDLAWYFLPYPSRTFLKPEIQVSHREEVHFEMLSTKAQVALTRTFDGWAQGGNLYIGPSANMMWTFRGAGPQVSYLAALESGVHIESHAFELNRSSPIEGWRFSATALLADRSLWSSFTAQRIDLKWETLWNLKKFDPSLWVLGARGGGGVTFVPTETTLNLLPANYRRYLGGAADLRGFGRQGLPGPDGGLTSVFAGVEARLTHTLPWSLDPFVFIDAGAMGAKPLSLDLDFYTSPGLGLRWSSPVGTIRGTLARGFKNSDAVQWQGYIGIGEEF